MTDERKRRVKVYLEAAEDVQLLSVSRGNRPALTEATVLPRCLDAFARVLLAARVVCCEEGPMTAFIFLRLCRDVEISGRPLKPETKGFRW